MSLFNFHRAAPNARRALRWERNSSNSRSPAISARITKCLLGDHNSDDCLTRFCILGKALVEVQSSQYDKQVGTRRLLKLNGFFNSKDKETRTEFNSGQGAIFERNHKMLKAPKSRQYIANGVSVLVLKYLVKNFTDRYDAIAAQAAPSRAASIVGASVEASSTGNLKMAAAAIIGVAKRKEKRSASS